jgi:glycerophosphoryl diester phosphodiesterase
VQRGLLATALGLVVGLVLPGLVAADEANPWMNRRVLNFAHQGGEIEAPSNTMFAFKTAAEKGADVLELDVHATADRELVVIHDSTVDRTTGGTGTIDEMTLEEVRALDAAYWFVPDCGTCHDRPVSEYAYRGFATGDRAIPRKMKRFSPSDFKIPTLGEVLQTFPDYLINIEIKETVNETIPYEQELADLLAKYDRTMDTIVVSFTDDATERFKVLAPDVGTATGTAETGAFWATTNDPAPGLPNPRYQALQVPIVFNGITVVTEDFVEDAHANNLAVHVWTINDADTMRSLIDMGVDGIMTDRPTVLERVLEKTRTEYRP